VTERLAGRVDGAETGSIGCPQRFGGALVIVLDAHDPLFAPLPSRSDLAEVDDPAASFGQTGTPIPRRIKGSTMLEQSVLPEFAGLIRSTERLGRRDRFERFGAAR
jgi:hypothetical protein